LSGDFYIGRYVPASEEYIEVSRPPTTMDRFNAWLDRVMGR
jgi:hypothetical protein